MKRDDSEREQYLGVFDDGNERPKHLGPGGGIDREERSHAGRLLDVMDDDGERI